MSTDLSTVRMSLELSARHMHAAFMADSSKLDEEIKRQLDEMLKSGLLEKEIGRLVHCAIEAAVVRYMEQPEVKEIVTQKLQTALRLILNEAMRKAVGG